MSRGDAVIGRAGTRRRRAIAVAVCAALGLAAFSFGGATKRPARALRAGPAAIAAFVHRAQAALDGPLSVSYRAVLASGRGRVVEVTARGASVPRALLRGLQRAAAAYRDSEPAYLLDRTVAGRSARCLQFGNPARPLGSVCLARDGLIAFYDLPVRVTTGAYRVATLESSSTR